jgi:F-type H+-transporting ATPase subunit epsilon
MRVVVATHQGYQFNDEVDYVLVHDNVKGEFTIMKNHIPVVSVMDEGYLKVVRGEDIFYVVVVSGILQFQNNYCSVLVQEAHLGRTPESAKEHLLAVRKDRLEKNRKESADFTQKEKDLAKNIKKSGAGRI